MDEGRAALVKMIRAVDPVFDFVRRNPDCLRRDDHEIPFREVLEWFHQRVYEDFGYEDQQTLDFAVTTNGPTRNSNANCSGGQRRNSCQSRRDPTRIREMVQRRPRQERRERRGASRRARSGRDGDTSSPVSMPNSGRNISLSSWTTSTITATPGFRGPTPPPTATGSARGSQTNATASRGACSIPIARCGSRSCRAGRGAHEPGGRMRKPRHLERHDSDPTTRASSGNHVSGTPVGESMFRSIRLGTWSNSLAGLVSRIL